MQSDFISGTCNALEVELDSLNTRLAARDQDLEITISKNTILIEEQDNLRKRLASIEDEKNQLKLKSEQEIGELQEALNEWNDKYTRLTNSHDLLSQEQDVSLSHLSS